jgi:hypothetical protein
MDKSGVCGTLDKMRRASFKIHNLKGLEEDSTKFLYNIRLSAQLNDTLYSSAQNMYRDVVERIHEAASEALGEEDEPNADEHRSPWWIEETESLVSEKKELHYKWLTSEDPEDRKAYIRANREEKKCVTVVKNEMWQKRCGYIGRYKNKRGLENNEKYDSQKDRAT